MNWDDLKILLAVAEQQTLSGAAQKLSLNQTTISRRVRQLEQQLDTLLLQKTAQGYCLTEAARDLLGPIRRMEQEASAIARQLSQQHVSKPAGKVRITATEMVLHHFVLPGIPKLEQMYPDITLELICDLKVRSLSRMEADVAIRYNRPQQQDLVARRLFNPAYGCYASQAYLDRYPDTGEMINHRFLSISSDTFKLTEQEQYWMEVNDVVLESNQVGVLLNACLRGQGVFLIHHYIGEQYPELVRMNIDFPRLSDLWLAIHKDNHKQPAIKAVGEWLMMLAEPLRDKPSPPKKRSAQTAAAATQQPDPQRFLHRRNDRQSNPSDHD